jgi:hypothetical protein
VHLKAISEITRLSVSPCPKKAKIMAKTNGVNKSQAVREYLKASPTSKNQEVVDALAKKGITITANYVGNIKAAHNQRQRARRKVVAAGGVGIPEVKAALAFLKVTGSVAAATKALKVAQEIRAIV